METDIIYPGNFKIEEIDQIRDYEYEITAIYEVEHVWYVPIYFRLINPCLLTKDWVREIGAVYPTNTLFCGRPVNEQKLLRIIYSTCNARGIYTVICGLMSNSESIYPPGFEFPRIQNTNCAKILEIESGELQVICSGDKDSDLRYSRAFNLNQIQAIISGGRELWGSDFLLSTETTIHELLCLRNICFEKWNEFEGANNHHPHKLKFTFEATMISKLLFLECEEECYRIP